MFNLNTAFKKNGYVGKFGVSALDDKLKGIMGTDLVLIGARSGCGKSSLANSIAFINRDSGFKTALYSLENFENDIYLERAYYRYVELTRDYEMNIRDFMSGEFMKNERGYHKEALKKACLDASNDYKDIILHTRQANFTIQNLCDSVGEDVVNNEVRLVILDHIDYFDKDYPDESDISHISTLMRTIRRLQNTYNVGFVCISHLRKAMTSKETVYIPSMDEFIGSSNKVKESTVVVMFATDDETNEANAGKKLRSTFCCIRKSRFGGVDNQAYRLDFDIRTGTYKKSYDVLSVNYTGTKKSLLRTEIRAENDGSYGNSIKH